MPYQAETDMLTFVNDHWIPGIVDQIGEMSTLMKLLMRTNGLTTTDGTKPGLSSMVVGGPKVKRSLRHSRAASRGSMSGYDTLKVDPNRKYDFALFPWSTYYVALPQSWDEMLEARGKEAVNNWLEENLAGMVSDLMDMIGTGLYNNAAALTGLPDDYQGKGIHGLRELCAISRPWGGIDSTDYSWWDSFLDATAHTIANLEDPTHDEHILKLIRIGIDGVTHGGKMPTHVMVTRTIFNLIEDTMKFQKIYGAGVQTADIGYKYINYRGVEIVAEHDDYIPAFHIFYLHLKPNAGKLAPLNFKGREGAWFKLTDWREPTNQLARVRFLVAQCMLYCDEPRVVGMNSSIGAT